MVSFICDACGNTVKKTQVEKHYSTVCRGCSVLSCLDCGVDFPGDSYIGHTSCVTEAEKYQGHLYQAKDKENKGETKQKEWLKNIHGTSSNSKDPKLKALLKRLSAYSNIPRKKKKFENFCKNSVNVYDAKTLDQLWDLFNVSPVESNVVNESLQCAKESEEIITSETSDDHKTTEILDESDCKPDMESLPIKKKKKKRKHIDEEKVNENGSTPNESDEPKIKKKKKKHLINTETECSGKLDDTVVDDNMDSHSVEKVENGQAIENEVNKDSKSKKKKCKHKKGNVENEIGVVVAPKRQKKSKKKRNKEILGSGDVNGDVSGGEEPDNSQDDNKSKERETEVEDVEGKKKNFKQNGVIECDKKENEEEQLNNITKGKFNWHKTIKTILKESENHELSLKKLRKKVLSAYEEYGVDHRAPTLNESRALFDKKLKSYPKVKLLKDNVKLVK